MRNLFFYLTLVTALLSTTPLMAQLASCTGNDVGGIVFREFTADGIQDTGEIGLEGITVNAYTGSGLASTTTTLSDGSYSLDNLVAGVTYRIEFIWTENYLEPSPVGNNSNTSVQFILAGTCNTNFGLHNPGDFCEDNPRLYTACYQDFEYDGPNASKDALVSWEYNEGGGNNPTTKQIEGTQLDVGSVWGLAHQKDTETLLWASFMKRHVGFGPDGIGAIYQKEEATGNISLWADLESILGAGTLGTNPHSAGTDMACDPNSWEPVGKRSFGDLEISDDQSTLYTINLNTRELYKIDITDFPATPIAADIAAISIPLLNTAAGNHVANTSDPSPSTNMRPFGLGFHDGTLYLGVVYSAESSQNTADMYGYVYSFDPLTNSFNPTPAISYPLNYPRGCAVNLCSTYGGDADWNPWAPTWTIESTRFGREKVYPQPWISDIEFTDDGYMVLAMRDRFGDQTGFNQESTSCSGLYHGDVAGDLLMAAPNGNDTWTLESGGTVGAKSASGSEGPTQGPGNAEFFWSDFFYDSYFKQVLHEETSLGSVVILPGKNEVVSTNFDGTRDFQGGVAYFSTNDGSSNNYIELYRSTSSANSTFGKGGGLGDIEAACSAAPIEIGNYVWNDIDKDGIQDPEETVFAGVEVNIYVEDANVPGSYILVGKTVTDANGNYIFNDSNVDMNGVSSINGNPSSGNYTGLDPFTTYHISINNSSQYDSGSMLLEHSGKNYFLTTNDASSNGLDQIDSDGIISSTAGAPFDGYPTITANVLGAGQNDHSFDFGFYELGCDVLVGLSATQNSICSSNETVDFTVTYQTDDTGNYRLLYHTSSLTTAQLYAGMGTDINANLAATANQNYTVENNIAFPPNISGSSITYYVYTILRTDHPEYTAIFCEPVVETTVTVLPETPTATFSTNTQTVCSADNGSMENVLDLNSLIATGPTSGTWADTDASGGLSGSTFTSTSAMEGNVYQFTYTLNGAGTTSNCADNTYLVFIEVVNCPCTTNAITLCTGETWDATATIGTTNFQWYKDEVLIGGATNSTYTITALGEYYYTAEDASGCSVELTCRITVTDGNPSAVLSSTSVNICNVSLGDSDNVIDLSSLILSGDMSGTWIDTDGSGSLLGNLFTATNGQAGNTYTVTYQVTGTAPCTNTNYPVTINVQNCSCPLLNAVIVPSPICQSDIFSVTASHSSPAGDLAIYYNAGSVLTATDLYSAGNGGAALLNTISSPTGTSSSSFGNSLPAGTYNIYLVLDTTNPEHAPPTCQPMAITSITVQDVTESVTIANPPTICNVDLGAGDNTLDLNSLISSGPTTGTWNDDDATGGLSGSVFTASTVGTFDFTYTITGPGGSGGGACSDQSYTISVTVQDCSCPILTLSGAPAQLCSDDAITIDFNHSSNPGDLVLYYFPDDGTGLTTAQIYNFGSGNGGATQLGATISPATNSPSTTIPITLPQNTTGGNVSYLIYGILDNGNTNYSAGICEPVALTSVLVKPETETATLTPTASICEADFGNSENVIDLNTLITAGDTLGTWTDDNNSGGLIASFFTATPAMAGNTYNFTYTISGVDGAGSTACHDNSYTVAITVNTCTVPCPDFTNFTSPIEICSSDDFDITLDFESGIGNISLYYANDISLIPGDFYTDNSSLTIIDDNISTSGTSYTRTISLPANTDTVVKKIYLYAALAPSNGSINNPFCLPFRTYIVRQLPEGDALTICNDASNTTAINAQSGLTNVIWFNSADTQVGTGNTLLVDANTPGMSDGTDSYYYTADEGNGCEIGLCCPVIVQTEDCPIYDWGDLPDTASGTAALDYETSAANGGPSHLIIDGLHLGPDVDNETDGQPDGTATGDGADENGLTLISTLDIVPGGGLNLPFSATNTTGNTAFVELYIDWNGDGDFNDSDEFVINIDDSANPLPTQLNVNVPTTVIGQQAFGVRLRISNTDMDSPYGQVESGEVEDYLLLMDCQRKICLPVTFTIKRGQRN